MSRLLFLLSVTCDPYYPLSVLFQSIRDSYLFSVAFPYLTLPYPTLPHTLDRPIAPALIGRLVCKTQSRVRADGRENEMKIVERDFYGDVLEGTVSIDGSSFFLSLLFFDVQIRGVLCVLYTIRG